MPTPTYTPLATVTLGSATTSVTFSSIPATYRDLILVFDGLATADQGFIFRFNGDSGSNYPNVFMRGYESTIQSLSDTGSSIPLNHSATDSGTRCLSIVQIMDYSATDKHKSVLIRGNYDQPTAGKFVEATAARWANTAAVTSIVVSSASNLGVGSRIDLYGIAS
jgi:hypothetical protein